METRQDYNGIWYSVNTPIKVAQVINQAYANQKRIRVYYGDRMTGQSWLEENDIIGTIGRSTGDIKIPLLINNRRSTGGVGLLDHCIVAIQDFKTKEFLYKQDNFNIPKMTLASGDNAKYPFNVYRVKGGDLQARFKTKEQAQRYIDFIYGKRMNNEQSNR